ncbi:hypothetical protein Tco_0420654 [Tanacetum coccineum]
MSSMSEDIQCAGSDTRPPMLDRTDFESWQQRIRLYCLGKDNGENIMKSINEGPFHMGTVSDVIAGGTEGAVQQGPVRARVLNDLSAEEKERYKADIRATNILLQGIPKDIYSLINHYTDAKDIWENVKMILEGSELTKDDRESQSQHEVHANENRIMMERFIQPNNDPLALVSNASVQQEVLKQENLHWKVYPTQLPSSLNVQINLPQSTITIERRLMQGQSYGSRWESCGLRCPWKITMRNNQGSHVQRNNANRKWCSKECRRSEQRSQYYTGQAKSHPIATNCKRTSAQSTENERKHVNVDDDVDDSPENDLALNVDHVFEADECDAFDSDVDEDEYHEVHEMQTDEQHNYVVDSDADYTSNSNIIPYDQYVEDNEDHVVQRNVSSVRNDALYSKFSMEMHEHGVQSRLSK